MDRTGPIRTEMNKDRFGPVPFGTGWSDQSLGPIRDGPVRSVHLGPNWAKGSIPISYV